MTRTTLVLDEQLLIDLKKLAAEQRRTLTSVVDEFLRQGLRQKQKPKKGKRVKLPSWDMGEFPFDVSSREAMYDWFDKNP